MADERRYYALIETHYGHEVKVYEASVATEPCLWVNVNLTPEMVERAHASVPPEEATALLTLDQARRLRDALDACIDNHYQNATS